MKLQQRPPHTSSSQLKRALVLAFLVTAQLASVAQGDYLIVSTSREESCPEVSLQNDFYTDGNCCLLQDPDPPRDGVNCVIMGGGRGDTACLVAIREWQCEFFFDPSVASDTSAASSQCNRGWGLGLTGAPGPCDYDSPYPIPEASKSDAPILTMRMAGIDTITPSEFLEWEAVMKQHTLTYLEGNPDVNDVLTYFKAPNVTISSSNDNDELDVVFLMFLSWRGDTDLEAGEIVQDVFYSDDGKAALLDLLNSKQAFATVTDISDVPYDDGNESGSKEEDDTTTETEGNSASATDGNRTLTVENDLDVFQGMDIEVEADDASVAPGKRFVTDTYRYCDGKFTLVERGDRAMEMDALASAASSLHSFCLVGMMSVSMLLSLVWGRP